MTNLEDDLRRRLHAVATTQTVPPDYLDRVERRARRATRRRPARNLAAAAAAIVLVAGAAVVATGGSGGGGDGATPVASADAETRSSAPATAPVPSGWVPMAASPLSPRGQHLTLAMGDQVLVWGGTQLGELAYRVDGAVYDPATDTWTAIPDAPLAAAPAAGVWTGEEAILVTGGAPGTHAADAGGPAEAAAYDPATDTWRELAAPPVDVTPSGPSAVWTGTQVVVLGAPATTGDPSLTTTAIYDPATDTWATGTSTDLVVNGTVVWTGSEVLMVADATVDGIAREIQVRGYDPATDTWRSLPWGLDGGVRTLIAVAWTGDRLFVGGGWTFGGTEIDQDAELEEARQAALLDPVTGAWTATSPAPVPFFGPGRGPVLWTGDRVMTLNGAEPGSLPPVGMGMGSPLTYDPATDTWTAGSVRPGEGGIDGAGWAWSAGRAVVPLGGVATDRDGDQAPDEYTPVPGGGTTYTP